jgi:type II secretory pathway pseudopilin PulG
MNMGSKNSSSMGFNLVELLVVIATVSVLALLVLPALANNDSRGQILQCLNNQKQLASAWLLYADDNNGNLVPNQGSPPNPSSFPPKYPPAGNDIPDWVWWNMQNSSDVTNTALITYGLLFPYTKNVALYKCPGNQIPMLRGISMNCNVGNTVYVNGYR